MELYKLLYKPTQLWILYIKKVCI